MWKAINDHVDFQNKFVIDIGSGYCDIAMMAVDAGAHTVVCIEKAEHVYNKNLKRLEYGTYSLNINLINADAEKILYGTASTFDMDIAICTSVLAYLKNPTMMLAWMSKHAKLSIIETQYIGDGPGNNKMGIFDDEAMKFMLKTFTLWNGKNGIRKIGETKIGIRPGTRSIWLCKRKGGAR